MLRFLFVLLLAGCSSSAPNLPQDYGTHNANKRISAENFTFEERQLSCSQINQELIALNRFEEVQLNEIQGKRKQNQVAGYFGSLFLFPLVGTDNSNVAKHNLTKINQAKDKLYKLQVYKNCSV